jgi:hypothetical protein
VTRRNRLWLLIASLAILLAPRPAEALKFEPVDPKELPAGVRSALWVRDCGRAFQDKQCADGEEMFSTGDSVKLASILSARRYDEVWLASGGGVLDEGLAIGEVLRRFQATVRVPPGRRCVSSCTVAFLGGVFRYIDEGATYQVHAASLFLDTDLDDPWMKDVVSDPATGLVEWADRLLEGFDLKRNHISGARESAKQLLIHCQKALNPLGQLPPGREQANRERLDRWVRAGATSAYRKSEQLSRDVDAIRREGVVAVQEILMRLERDTMQQAIDELRPMLPDLGPRAEPALRMLETMYSSRITGTASLSYETLLQMGYITKIFDPRKP